MNKEQGQRYYVDPKTLSPKQIRAIQALSARGRPAPVADGVVHCGRASFRVAVAIELDKLGIMYRTNTELGECWVLSKVGAAIAPRIQRWRVDI